MRKMQKTPYPEPLCDAQSSIFRVERSEFFKKSTLLYLIVISDFPNIGIKIWRCSLSSNLLMALYDQIHGQNQQK